ncbi:MAG: hypothetical protein PHW63_01285 [Alphaproteobacteria bacterium]|nr:hypothetical protein [Alphaproteobacteria bacterium]
MTEATDGQTSRESEYEKIVESSMAVMSELAVVLDQETALVGKKDAAEIAAVRAEKAKLIRDYRSSMTIVIQNPDLLEKLAASTRARLKQIGEVLATATEKNVKTLKVAVEATQALVGTIMETARKQCKAHDSYSDPRKLPSGQPAYAGDVMAVAVNRTA